MCKGSMGVKVNENVGRYFQTKKFKTKDPLSPILFNLVAGMLAFLISRAKEDGQIIGLVPHLIDGGLSILQYADDIILFIENDLEQAKDMKLLLCAFEKLSGFKINFHKSELFYYEEAKEIECQYTSIFGCGLGKYPFRYLGIPIHHKRIGNTDWKIIEENFEKKLSSWKGKLLSYGGRLVLINSILSSLAMIMLSFYEVPKCVLHKLDLYRSRFFLQGEDHKKKYRLAKWSIMCRPKDQGGLGVIDLGIQNRCLLSKWLFNLIKSDSVWQQLLRNKYLGNKILTQVNRKHGVSKSCLERGG
jgi:hypothetical protein